MTSKSRAAVRVTGQSRPARRNAKGLSLADMPADKVFPPKGRRMSKKQLGLLLTPITMLTRD